jgi:pimeloyl-ACP methyl ester carboxylesterase
MTSQPRTPGRERRIAAGAVELAATEYPAPGKPPLVLLHGIGSRAVSWWPVIDGLAPHFHLYALDLRGHGASAKPETGYLLADYAADLAAAIDGLGLARPLLLGHSLGALVALTWAGTDPERAAALVLEDPSLRTEPSVLEAFDGWIQLNAVPVTQAAAWYRQQYPDWTDEDCQRRADSITCTARGVFAELRADAAARLAAPPVGDPFARLAAVRTSTLLLAGERALGAMLAPQDAAHLVATMPNARLMEIRGAGHGLHRDQPAAFLAAVVPFLARAGRQL